MNQNNDNGDRYWRDTTRTARDFPWMQIGDLTPGVQVGYDSAGVKGDYTAFTTHTIQNLTKRELFAGLAMCGMLAAGNSAGVAFHAVEHADQLIKELENAK